MAGNANFAAENINFNLMKERNNKTILMLLASIILSAFTCLADGQPSGTSQGSSGGGTLDTVRKGFDRIRMPSRDRIMIYYNI